MTEGLWGQTVTCDNFFTSYSLGQELLKRKLTMVGTVRKNKAELLKELLEVKDRRCFTSKFVFTDTHALVSYCPKKRKNALLISTLHRDAAVSRREDKKSQMILDYNSNKGGVHNLDKVTTVYICKRKTARWPLVVFVNILDVTANNAFVLGSEINPTWNTDVCVCEDFPLLPHLSADVLHIGCRITFRRESPVSFNHTLLVVLPAAIAAAVENQEKSGGETNTKFMITCFDN
ncbi:hypothetical protein ABVT39_013632 [Epinephelus coioides]